MGGKKGLLASAQGSGKAVPFPAGQDSRKPTKAVHRLSGESKGRGGEGGLISSWLDFGRWPPFPLAHKIE